MWCKKITLTALWLVVMTGMVALAQQQNGSTVDTVPEPVRHTIQTEYPTYKRIEITLVSKGPNNKKIYRVAVHRKDVPMDVIFIQPTGQWLRKSSFIGMTEMDLAIVIKVQDITGKIDELKNWNKVVFPDGTLEFRVYSDEKNKLYAWNKEFVYLGVVRDDLYPTRDENILQPDR